MKVTLISFAPNFMLVTTSKVCADGSRPFPSHDAKLEYIHDHCTLRLLTVHITLYNFDVMDNTIHAHVSPILNSPELMPFASQTAAKHRQ